MKVKSQVKSGHLLVALAMAALLLPGCGDSQTGMPQQSQTGTPQQSQTDISQQSQTETLPAVDMALDPFLQLARTGACTDIRNRLFLIDDALVLWDRQGSCADNAYAVTLYDGYNSQALCNLHDSIMGPVKGCTDARLTDMFNTITGHLAAPNLGLGSGHTVDKITF